jgi:kynureninase
VEATRQAARALDAADPLASRREQFVLPDGVIYLDGNSFGALPAAVPGRLGSVVAGEWRRDLVRAWNTDGWWTAPPPILSLLALDAALDAFERVGLDVIRTSRWTPASTGTCTRITSWPGPPAGC